jgi:D-glycero-D-manno-heptose 1,7-bisphosphate phosphatase
MDIKELEIMTEQLNSNFSFKEISYCIHDDSDNCNCRKPKPGMIISLLDKYNLQKEESILVGDSSKDISAGKNAGIKTVVLQTDYNRDSDINSDFEVGSLTEIIRIIKE